MKKERKKERKTLVNNDWHAILFWCLLGKCSS
jgi:hypothetical protein